MVNARDSHGNAYGVFISPAGWWTLAGGNTPGYYPARLRPEGAPESTIGYPIRPISLIRPIPPGQECESLIQIENGLRLALSQTCYRPIIRPKNKEIKPNTNPHKPKKFTTRSLRKVARGCYPPKSENLIYPNFSNLALLSPVKPH
jgi:hypothetical protein